MLTHPVHTMEELHFTGNCLKGSRPILSFDSTFDSQPHLRVIKELLTHTFGVPKSSRKTKPFVDHVMGFTVADGRIWIRCYQIDETEEVSTKVGVEGKPEGKSSSSKGRETEISLIEIGPRFVMTPIVIQESSFGGPIIYENKEFVSPNQIRSDLRIAKAGRHIRRTDQGADRLLRQGELGLTSKGGRKREKSALDNEVLFR